MQFSIQQLAAALLSIATASAVSVWYMRGEQIDVLKEKISAYEISGELKLSSLAKNAELATRKLATQLAKLENIETLSKSNESQNNLISELSKSNEEQLNKILLLESQVRSIFSSSTAFSLKNGEHIKLFGAEYIFAVKKIGMMDVYYSLNNDGGLLSSGGYVKFEYKNKPCKLILESFEYDKVANFSVLCEK
ncbi:MAG: hypothetical protein ACI91R_002071 [Vicingaceae bacterium]|jgi:hypothetical protein